ncbi:MAG: hypothetical protein DCC56_15900 [Anaerolineae bacterium]|nr:MAG: hypothetical protein DCC56_15900 [Anaerolineae bacterium]
MRPLLYNHAMRFSHTLVLIAALALSGCNGKSSDVSAEGIPSPTPFQPQGSAESDPLFSAPAPTPLNLPTTTPIPTEIVILPETLPEGVDVNSFAISGALNPLTGLPPADPSLLNRRPMAIKVANYPRYMRPQSGLTLADQVFEYYIEDGLTRFIAVFYGNDSEWVGPVRSGRYFDEHIQRMYQAYLVFKFADPRELDYFKASDFAKFLVTPTNGLCPPFHFLPERINTVEEYNNSYFDTVRWKDCVTNNGMDNNHPYIRNGYYSDAAPAGDLPGTKINTYYSVDSYHYWEYNSNLHLYYRYQEINDSRDGEDEFAPLVDRVTGAQVGASNVIVLFVTHTFANAYDEDDEVFQIDLTGSGEAYVFRDGVGILAKWYRTNRDQPLLLTTLGGSPIYMRPGITFYEVIGSRSYVDQGDGEWSFRHDWP